MTNKPEVVHSKHWHILLFAIYISLLSSVPVGQLAAQVGEQNSWRRTIHGWEYAHAVQASSTPRFSKTVPKQPSAVSSLRQWHRIALPMAVSCFLVSFGCWSLISVPNRGITRQNWSVPV